MQLNTQWLSMAGAKAPIQLREVSLQDINNYIVVSSAQSIPVSLPPNANDIIQYVDSKSVVITEEMEFGVRPERFTQEKASEGITGMLILVHGYCVKKNPWVDYLDNFSQVDYVEFVGCSDANDQFANKIYQYVTSKGYTSFSLLGYSQGGMAINHLKTFYWSGLDTPTKGKTLQSLVTPYQGNSLAGSTATLGQLFGAGCGANYDLTRDGASLWANTIPSSTRKYLSFYYVQYDDQGLNTRYCNAALNTMMQKPNDGVTEVPYATFSGATSMGLTQGQCHAVNMKYPPAYTDQTRNRAMNAAAARS
jgi:hypothetical protein